MNLSGAALLEKPKAHTLIGDTPSRGVIIPTIEEQVEIWRQQFEDQRLLVERKRQDEERRIYREQMSINNWVGMLNSGSQGVSGTSFTGTSITNIGPAPDFTMPGGVPAGTVLRLTCSGLFTVSGSGDSLTLQFMYGGTGGTSLYTTGSIALTASASNQVFHLECLVRFLSTGTGGSGAGQFSSWGRQQGVSTTANIGVPTQALLTATNINTITSNTIIVTGTSTTALTSLIVYKFIIEQLN